MISQHNIPTDHWAGDLTAEPYKLSDGKYRVTLRDPSGKEVERLRADSLAEIDKVVAAWKAGRSTTPAPAPTPTPTPVPPPAPTTPLPAGAKVLVPGNDLRAFLRSIPAGGTGALRGGVYDYGTNYIETTASNITIQSYPGERATIKGLERMDFRGTNTKLQSLNLHGGGAIGMDGDGWKVFDCDRTNNFATFGNAAHTEYGIAMYAKGDNGQARGNFFHQIGRLTADPISTPAGRAASQPHSHGWYVSGANNCTFTDERAYQLLGGFLIHVYPSGSGHQVIRPRCFDSYLAMFAGGSTLNATVSGAACVWKQTAQNPPVYGGASPVPSRAPNGVVYQGKGAIKDSVLYATAGSWGTDGVENTSAISLSNILSVDPQFRNPAAGDFYIQNSQARAHLGL